MSEWNEATVVVREADLSRGVAGAVRTDEHGWVGWLPSNAWPNVGDPIVVEHHSDRGTVARHPTPKGAAAPSVMIYPGGFITKADMHRGMIEAIAEAERGRIEPLPPSHVGFYETHAEMLRALDDQIRAMADALRLHPTLGSRCATVPLPAEHRHNAMCPRCFGPAYQGLGLPQCEREGGCLADRVPVLGEREWGEDDEGADVVRDFVTTRAGMCEWGYRLAGTTGPYYATVGAAIAAWRDALLGLAAQEAVDEGRIRRAPVKYWKRSRP